MHPPPTHTHTVYIGLRPVAFSRQQWFRERASKLRYTYVDSLVSRKENYNVMNTAFVSAACQLEKNSLKAGQYTKITIFLQTLSTIKKVGTW